MIKPNKHTEIKYSIVYLSAVIMKEILENGIIKFDDLKTTIKSKIGNGVSENFEYSLSYLFLLGKIEYNKTSDLIRTVEQ